MGTDLPFLLRDPPAVLCGLHQVLCVVERDPFPPILHVLMAKLGLNSGVANSDGRVLLLWRGYGMEG